jgi:Dolichyl-phosphate-mannose-protein mannosyltransferase
MKIQSLKHSFILLGFVSLKFILQYSLISPEYDLQRDEYLHLNMANHLAWGYVSVPPVTSWISYIIGLLGNGVFWVKFFPALFGALTIIFVWKTVEALNGNVFALVLSATCVLFSAVLRLNVLFQPNSLDLLCWMAFYYVVIRYFQTEQSKWLYYGALVFAIGFLNKYNIVFLVAGLLPAVLVTPQRNVIFNRHFYFACLLALVLISPNLAWQYNNGFPVIHHLQELASRQLVHVERATFLKNQLLFFTGAIFVIPAALYALFVYPEFKKYKAFFWALPFTLFIFTYLKAKDYYAMGLYPVSIAFGSVYLAQLLHKGWERFLQPVLIALPVLFFMLMFKIAFPNKSPDYIVNHSRVHKKLGLLRWEDGKDHALPQDFADMLGWKELAVKIDSVFSALPHPDETLVLCDNYGQAGAINYYKTNPKLTASSFNADYINWLRYDRKITDVILVKEEKYDDDKERKTEIPLVDTVYLADRRVNQYAIEDTISIYVLRGAKIDVNKRIKEEANRKKKYD